MLNAKSESAVYGTQQRFLTKIFRFEFTFRFRFTFTFAFTFEVCFYLESALLIRGQLTKNPQYFRGQWQKFPLHFNKVTLDHNHIFTR
jgi:hypothetical protein